MLHEHAALKTMMGLSFGSLTLIYSLMLIGIYITASHQGLSCSGWPLCPNGFNFPPEKYFFEHFHRLIAIITAVSIVANAIYATKKAKGLRKITIIASVIIAIQIIEGLLIVSSKLEPLLVAAHLSTAVTLFAAMLMTFLFAYKLMTKPNKL
jgi:heme A synthase